MKVAFVSGKGGTGKSSIAAAFVAMSERVVAVDCDVDTSNLPLLFDCHAEWQESFVSGTRACIDREKCVRCGACAGHCAYGAIHAGDDRVEVDPMLCEGCGLCGRVCPAEAIALVDEANSRVGVSRFGHGILVHGWLYPGDDNSGKMIARLRAIADERMKAESIPLQILDGPPGIGCPVLSTITGMEKLVIVSEPTQSGMADLQRVYELGISFCKQIFVIINKCDLNEEKHRAMRRLCSSLDVPILAELPFDKGWIEAQIRAADMVTYAPDSGSARILKQAYKKLTAN